MASERCEVGVVVERRALKSRWADDVWQPYAVLPAVPPVAAGTPLDPGGRLIFAGAATLELLSALTSLYGDNLGAENPVVWVALSGESRETRIVTVCVDPDQGEALTADPHLRVEAVPMPDGIRSWVADFSARYPTPRLFTRHRRRRTEDV